jgi:hypothetical protein
MARRERVVKKLLDEPLKVLDLLTVRSCALVLFAFVATYLVGLLSGLWTRMGGHWGTLGPLVVAVPLAFVLRLVEANEDEHVAFAAIRFYLSRRTRCLFTAGCSDGFVQRGLAPAWMRLGLWEHGLYSEARRARQPVASVLLTPSSSGGNGRGECGATPPSRHVTDVDDPVAVMGDVAVTSAWVHAVAEVACSTEDEQ